jgi:hypothetical protein
MSEGRLQGRVLLVTGAARGIGRACVDALAAEGASLFLVDSGCELDGTGGDTGLIEAVVRDLSARGVAVEGRADDVAAPDAAASMVAQAIARFGRLDGVVHAAGLWADQSVLRLDPAVLDRVIATQLVAAFALVRHAGEAMVAQKSGSIVLMAGTSAFFGARGHAAMGAAQAGVVALARTSALELRRHHLRVNAVCPTARTRQTEQLPTFAAIDPASMSPEHVAHVVAFLLSDLAADVNGEAVGVAGSRVYAIRARETPGAFGEGPPLTLDALAALWPSAIRA